MTPNFSLSPQPGPPLDSTFHQSLETDVSTPDATLVEFTELRIECFGRWEGGRGEEPCLVHKQLLSSFLQTLLTKLCGQDRLLRRLQGEIDQRQEEKVQDSGTGEGGTVGLSTCP